MLPGLIFLCVPSTCLFLLSSKKGFYWVLISMVIVSGIMITYLLGADSAIGKIIGFFTFLLFFVIGLTMIMKPELPAEIFYNKKDNKGIHLGYRVLGGYLIIQAISFLIIFVI